jgi:hypothetical protein
MQQHAAATTQKESPTSAVPKGVAGAYDTFHRISTATDHNTLPKQHHETTTTKSKSQKLGIQKSWRNIVRGWSQRILFVAWKSYHTTTIRIMLLTSPVVQTNVQQYIRLAYAAANSQNPELAEEILDYMKHPVAGAKVINPYTMRYCYVDVICAYANDESANYNMQRAGQILLEECLLNQSFFPPSIREVTEAILSKLYDHCKNGTDDSQLHARHYNAILTAWVVSGHPDAAINAQALFHELQQKYKKLEMQI